ncbi:hypothetical protein [Flexithrix dorotheae]|uniref:hypothetical protein n=1 Tax=Flexithrix dorotheae TaxID=70993 RepID=UPI00036D88EB|nr:hypothetical protein [Flexithrix dorotheae]
MSNSPFKITLSEATKFVQDYVDEFIKIGGPSIVPNIIGGTIKKDLLIKQRDIAREKIKILNESGPYEGLVAWFCWELASNIRDTMFFLSFEVSDWIILGSEELQRPDFKLLSRPFDIYRYNSDLDKDIEKLLVEHGPERMQEAFPDLIERGDSNTEVGKVLKLRLDFHNSGPKEPSGEKYNDTPFGVFENEKYNDVDDFLEQPNLEYIRYYFGYDKTKDQNKIRVILVGVDANKKNMVPRNDTEAKSTGPYILQKSWPPGED